MLYTKQKKKRIRYDLPLRHPKAFHQRLSRWSFRYNVYPILSFLPSFPCEFHRPPVVVALEKSSVCLSNREARLRPNISTPPRRSSLPEHLPGGHRPHPSRPPGPQHFQHQPTITAQPYPFSSTSSVTEFPAALVRFNSTVSLKPTFLAAPSSPSSRNLASNSAHPATASSCFRVRHASSAASLFFHRSRYTSVPSGFSREDTIFSASAAGAGAACFLDGLRLCDFLAMGMRRRRWLAGWLSWCCWFRVCVGGVLSLSMERMAAWVGWCRVLC
ncbi:hypothetical protein FN846DRAFT_334247 [Sphaerosporella brunnea]|uniref:Uncharacterized protein n=1 Tax=Sphaerosporella brunnea TaxID=1250544 RepID=A0A5J5EIK9_9PEZI|nr:hypothetical protein FN846DRAFT_334247 [Sphaerosporella brunnea]